MLWVFIKIGWHRRCVCVTSGVVGQCIVVFFRYRVEKLLLIWYSAVLIFIASEYHLLSSSLTYRTDGISEKYRLRLPNKNIDNQQRNEHELFKKLEVEWTVFIRVKKFLSHATNTIIEYIVKCLLYDSMCASNHQHFYRDLIQS